MATPKTIKLLLSLNKKERLKFKLFLQSPFFNTNDKLVETFEIITQTYTRKEFHYNKDEVLEVCSYEYENTFDTHLNRLGNLFEKFIVVQAFEEDEEKDDNQKNEVEQNEDNKNLFNRLILNDYFFREGGEFFYNKYTDAKRKLDKSTISIDKYHYKYKLEAIYDAYIKNYKDKRKGDANIQAVSNAIERDFVVKKLFYLISMYNRHNITKHKYDYGNEDFVKKYFKKDRQIIDPWINLLFQAYMVLVGSEKKTALDNLKQQLNKSDIRITKDLVFSLSTVVHNNLKYYIGAKQELVKEIFELHKILLDKKYALTNSKIPIYFYKNFISTCLELEEYDYAENIIEKYKNKLLSNELSNVLTNNVYKYCKALLFLHTNDAEKAMDQISCLEFPDVVSKFDLRCLKIMIYYDTANYLIEPEFNSFGTDLSRKQKKSISTTKILWYKNFFSCVKKINKLKNDPNTKKNQVEDAKEFLNSGAKFKNYKWLSKRVNDLLNKF